MTCSIGPPRRSRSKRSPYVADHRRCADQQARQQPGAQAAAITWGTRVAQRLIIVPDFRSGTLKLNQLDFVFGEPALFNDHTLYGDGIRRIGHYCQALLGPTAGHIE